MLKMNEIAVKTKMKPWDRKRIVLETIPKNGGKYTAKCIRAIKKIFNQLDISDRFDEVELSKYSRVFLQEIIFEGKKELVRDKPDGSRFFIKISKLPYRVKKRTHTKEGAMLVVGNINNYYKALKTVGSLSRPSKIPTFGYALPAIGCKTGSILKDDVKSTCHGCYGFSGWYNMPWVKIAMEKRSISIFNEDWVDAMIYLMKFHHLTEFRWHDTGDLQSVEHLKKIIDIAKATPEIKYWLPTQEYDIVLKYWEIYGVFPENIRHGIRLSARNVNEEPPIELARKLGVNVSMVVDNDSDIKFTCPSSLQANRCKGCRTCWGEEFLVIYKKH